MPHRHMRHRTWGCDLATAGELSMRRIVRVAAWAMGRTIKNVRENSNAHPSSSSLSLYVTSAAGAGSASGTATVGAAGRAAGMAAAMAVAGRVGACLSAGRVEISIPLARRSWSARNASSFSCAAPPPGCASKMEPCSSRTRLSPQTASERRRLDAPMRRRFRAGSEKTTGWHERRFGRAEGDGGGGGGVFGRLGQERVPDPLCSLLRRLREARVPCLAVLPAQQLRRAVIVEPSLE